MTRDSRTGAAGPGCLPVDRAHIRCSAFRVRRTVARNHRLKERLGGESASADRASAGGQQRHRARSLFAERPGAQPRLLDTIWEGDATLCGPDECDPP